MESTSLSWSSSGVYQESIRSPSGVYQESIRSLSGVHQEYQDFIRTPDGLHQDSWGSVTYSTLAKTFVINSRPRHFLPAIVKHAIYIEIRSPDPLNKSHLGISHIWACPITAVTLAKTFERL